MLLNWIKPRIHWAWMLPLLLIVVLTTSGLVTQASAIAAIRQLEESPGQVVYQSRQTLTDSRQKNWMTIAFKRIRPDGSSHVYLRLVGFPGTVAINHDRPLILSNSLGQTLIAADASRQIFTDASSPEPHIGQYDLQPLLPDLHAELSWRLSIPTEDKTAPVLPIPYSIIQEWQTLADNTPSF